MSARAYQKAKATAFKQLHAPGRPVVLYNVWDAGGARAVAEAGAPAIATGSHSVAAANGYEDGERIPLDLALRVAARIVSAVDAPVTIDFEGAYAAEAAGVRANVDRLMDTGAVGLNFEDQIVDGDGLYSAAAQATRIEAVRAAAEAKGVPLVINARTDVFLKAGDRIPRAALLGDAIERAGAYAAAGADCFFAPGLTDAGLIAELCAQAALPVNVMVADPTSDLQPLKDAGVARISFGPAPFAAVRRLLTETARALY